MAIYENVVELSRKMGVTIAKVERAVDLGNGTIGKWRTTSPNIENVKKVADFFGVGVDDLIKETGT